MFDEVHEAPKKSVLGWFSEHRRVEKGKKWTNCCFSPSLFLSLVVSDAVAEGHS